MTEWTERMRREYADVEILPLDAIRGLPKPGEFTGGIYFLWLAGELQYIGKSRDLGNRLNVHEYHRTIPFDDHTALVIDQGRIVNDQLGSQLKRLERAYIAHYEPPYNDLYGNVGT
jgi:hypothetical protein